MKSRPPFPSSHRLLLQALGACSGLFLLAHAGVADTSGMSMMPADAHAMSMPSSHAHAMSMPATPDHAMAMPMPSEADGYVRTRVDYTVPDVRMVDADGAAVSLRTALADKPVILNFIFTSCGAVCPVMSRIFSQVQTALGPDRDKVRMVSISIDPEEDTPSVLKAYAEKYGAGPEWEMLTGSLDASVAAQRAFNVYRRDKMDHLPTTFLRARPGQPWVRLDGFASAADILREYRQLAAN
jgi:protein SCO1/2